MVEVLCYFQIFYMEDAGFSFIDVPVENSIKIAMWKAIQHFKSNGLQTAPVSLYTQRDTIFCRML